MVSENNKYSVRVWLQQIIFFVLLFFCFTNYASADFDLDWARQYGTENVDEGHGVAVVGDRVFVSGIIGGALTGAPYNGNGDAFLREYDRFGNVVWTDQFGSSAGDYGLAVAANQNYVVVVGITQGVLPGKTNLGGQDIFIRTYDINNHQLILNQQVGTAGDDYVHGISLDDNYIYMAGSTQNQGSSQDAFLKKYHLTGGALIWSRDISTSQVDEAFGVSRTATGVYVTGFTEGALPGFTAHGDRDGFIKKFDTNGNELWAEQFGTAAGDLALGVSEYGSYVYVVGDTSGSLPGYSNAGYDDAFLRKYNASTGALVFTKQYGTAGYDEAFIVQADATGVYVGGFVEGELPNLTAVGGFDVYLQKFDYNGSVLSANQFGSVDGEDVYGMAMSNGYIYLTGSIDGSWNGYANAGGNDGYVARFSQDTDNDAIYDSIDTDIVTVSSAFTDGTTFGSVVTSGDQSLVIKDSLNNSEGVVVSASPSGGVTPAEVSACGISTFYLDAGDSVTITCGSVTFDVVNGSVRVVLHADDGRVAETTVSAGNEVKFVAADGSVIAAPSNTENVVLTAGNETVILAPGAVNEMPSDLPITVDAISLTPAALPIGSSATLYATVSSPLDEVSTITGVRYWVNGSTHVSASAADGVFDEATESIAVNLGTFAAAGVYEICVTGTDSVANVSQVGCTMLAVYDPAGGYVTGGGQIDSPAGAYTATPNLTGKAHFGFIAEYEQGAQTPTGNTQFRFAAGDLRFKSTSYDWLVVAGARAQYKGYGEIDKQAGYRFMLTAIDGDLLGQGTSDDKFRIKIWNDATGQVVYDNQLGASDTANLSTVISNGSIVIHAD